jgi:hypothetical protein
MSDRLGILGVVLLVLCPGGLAAVEQAQPMQLNLAEGFRFKARLAVETRCLTEVYTGEKVDYRRETLVELLCRVVEKRSDSRTRIELKYQWIRDVCSSEGTYDSAYPNRGRDDRIAPTFREKALDALIGQSFIAEIAPDGKVHSIQGLEDMRQHLDDALAYRPVRTSKIKLWGTPDQQKKWDEEGKRAREAEIGRFFRSYWPLSEQRMRDNVQELLLVWPQTVLDKGASWHTEDALSSPALRRTNSWMVQDKRADAVIVELTSDVCTDLNLCDPDFSLVEPWQDRDFVDVACHWYHGAKFAPMYAGGRTGLFTVDPRSGLIREATWKQELTGIVPLKDPSLGKPEPLACLSKHTQIVSIQITPQENEETARASK